MSVHTFNSHLNTYYKNNIIRFFLNFIQCTFVRDIDSQILIQHNYKNHCIKYLKYRKYYSKNDVPRTLPNSKCPIKHNTYHKILSNSN